MSIDDTSKVFTPQDFKLEVLKGNVPGTSVLTGFGERESIGTTSTGEDIWRGNQLSATPAALASHVLIPTPDPAGEQMSVISESVEDVAGGDGASTILITYIDGSGEEQTTPLILNGQTAVDVTPSDVKFVQSLNVVTLGSGNITGVTAGNIRIYKKADATLVYSMIEAGGNMSLESARMVPAGKHLYLQSWNAGEANAQGRLTMRLRADSAIDGDTLQTGVFLFRSTAYINRTTTAEITLGFKIPAGSTVKASAWAAAINSQASVTWWGYLINDQEIPLATRREQRKTLNVDEKIDFIHDDLDRGDKSFAGLRMEVRATLATVVMVLIAVLSTSFWVS